MRRTYTNRVLTSGTSRRSWGTGAAVRRRYTHMSVPGAYSLFAILLTIYNNQNLTTHITRYTSSPIHMPIGMYVGLQG